MKSPPVQRAARREVHGAVIRYGLARYVIGEADAPDDDEAGRRLEQALDRQGLSLGANREVRQALDDLAHVLSVYLPTVPGIDG